MSNTRYRISAQARSDLLAIGHYTELTWGSERRQTLRAQMLRHFQRLADFPLLGVASGIAHPASRALNARPFTIYYLPDPAGVIILRIVHQRQSDSGSEEYSDDRE